MRRSGPTVDAQGPQWVRATSPARLAAQPVPPTGRTAPTSASTSCRTALSLMATQGVDGTSMRNLAAATGLNVASLYHYFPSKRELLVAVLEERGFVDEPGRPAGRPCPPTRRPDSADLLHDILQSMLEVEDFIRLMMGEVMRGDDTAFAVGRELFDATQASLEVWLSEHQPKARTPEQQAALARMLRSLLVGLFFEYVAGVLGDRDPSVVFRERADEVAALLAVEASD